MPVEGGESPEEVPDDAMVIRFKPIGVEALVRAANQHFRDLGAYRISVFADSPRPGESEDDVVQRLIAASVEQGLSATSNPRFFVCSSALKIKAAGFTFWTDYDTDVPEHFSVDVGDENSEAQAREFVGCFESTARRRP